MMDAVRPRPGPSPFRPRVMVSPAFVVGVVSGEYGERVLLAALGLVWER